MSATVADHGEHGSKAWPNDSQYGVASGGKLGMWIFLLSDAFSFGGLLLAYGILRGGSHVWHNPGEPILGINFTAALTFLLICSSVTMVLAHAAAVEGKRKEMVRYLALTVLGGAAVPRAASTRSTSASWSHGLTARRPASSATAITRRRSTSSPASTGCTS